MDMQALTNSAGHTQIPRRQTPVWLTMLQAALLGLVVGLGGYVLLTIVLGSPQQGVDSGRALRPHGSVLRAHADTRSASTVPYLIGE
jgi:hypothetical protein